MKNIVLVVYSLLPASSLEHWLFAEHQERGALAWIWVATAALVVVALLALAYYAVYRRLEKRMTREVRRSNAHLALILKTSHVLIWQFHVVSHTIVRYDENGSQEDEGLSPAHFFRHLLPEDVERIDEALRQVASRQRISETLDVRACGDDGQQRSYTIALSVLHRDKSGQPTVIIGTTHDVTAVKARQQQVKDTMLRYQSMFNSMMIDTVAYDEQGYVTDMNAKASQAFPGGRERALRNRIHLRDVMGTDDLSVDQLERTWMTRIYDVDDDRRVFNEQIHQNKMYYELQLVPVRDAAGRLQSVFGTGIDVSDAVGAYLRQQQDALQQEQANKQLGDYVRNIDYVLKNGGVRLAHYSLETHTLVVYNEIGHAQYSLTQMRSLALLDQSSRKIAQRMFNSMDNRTQSALSTTVKTVIRNKDGSRLHLYLSFIPTVAADGRISDYFGMCRDISEIKNTEEQLALETAKAQEIETVKNAFLRNMSYEIRIPLNSVVGFAELFDMEHAPADEPFFISEIKDNAAHLLKLINDILLLSRLDARMIEFKPERIDFALFFEPRCLLAWQNHHQEEVQLMVDNPYQRLMVEVDTQNLGVVIDHIVANAAEHTTSGHVLVRYDYTGDSLVMAFNDTGCGISEERQQEIFERFVSTAGRGTGLGLCICHEIVQQMGGRINIKSEVGKGTIVWVTIPCKCSDIIRK